MPLLLDSTLREGELFRPLPPEVRVRVAEALAEAGVRRIELTVDYPPRTRREDVEKVVDVLRSYPVEVVIHGRAYRRDVEAAAGYDVDGVGVYIAPTRLHREYKLGGIGYQEAVERLEEAVRLARELGFRYRRATVEDASRFYVEDELESLAGLVDRLGEAGATLVSVPDTSGILSPPQAADLFRKLKQMCRTPLAAHFHNDYGHASSNTVEAALNGAEELHATILGIGDRNGVADLYEVAAALHDIHGVDVGVRRERVAELYRSFSRLTGIKIPFRHPLSEEARTVRAGVHQSMVIKRPEGYIPRGKLEHDFEGAAFEATPYLSRKIIAEILRGKVGEDEVRRAAETLAQEASRRGGRLTAKRVKEVLGRMGYQVDESAVDRLFKSERAYILLNLDPRYPVKNLLESLAEWEDVEQVDEVYGDADLIIVARIRPGGVVEKLRRSFADAIERMRILITD